MPRPVWFGFLLGLACTVRPFFAIHCVAAAGWSRRDGVKAGLAAVAGGLLPFALTGTSPLTWLRASSDASAYVAESGSVPGVLGLGTTGGPSLTFLDADGAERYRAALSSDGNLSFAMSDARERPRLILGVGREGEPFVGMRTADGGTRLTMAVTNDGEPTLTFYDHDGKTVTSSLPTRPSR